ncbi:MAG: hypothetical protein AB7V50_04970 [Vampirovibrionia bacterium]
MGLDISVGSLKYYLIDQDESNDNGNSELIKAQKEEYEQIIKVIKENIKQQTGQIPEWSEEESDEYDESTVGIRVGSYHLLHYLRRFAAHIDLDAKPPEPCRECDPTQDEFLLDIYDGKSVTKFLHLIDHSDCNGYYLPCDFDEPLWIDPEEFGKSHDDELVEYLSVGSSIKLKEELLELNKHLNIDLDKSLDDIYSYAEEIEGTDYEVEKWCLCILYKMCQASINLRLPVIFS